MNERVATEADLDAIAVTMAGAFCDDPVWSWAFVDPERREAQLTIWWRFFLASAVKHDWVWFVDPYATASVWIPPGHAELTPDEEAQIGPLLGELIGDRADKAMELVELFDASHPRDEPHFYLSLVGTHPDHRGRGLGLDLLASNLARIDDAHAPAFLEASNPVNVRLYERLGFEQIGEFVAPDAGPVVATMWRDAR